MPSTSLALSPELSNRLQRWANRLQAAGLGGLADTLLSIGSPLPLLGAQMLWVLQPALGALMPMREVGELAQLLNSDAGISRLRQHLGLDQDSVPNAEAGEVGTGSSD